MALINASSAIIAKARSKYGRRLTIKDYQALVKCETCGDVVQYLKTYTHYVTFLDKVSNDIHRGNLENIIREKQFEDFLTLCRYNVGSTPVTNYLFRRAEIYELMKFITLLSIDRPHEYLFTLPLYLDQHTDIHLSALSTISTHSGLLEALENTVYKNILKDFYPDENGTYDLPAIEDALNNCILDLLYADIGRIKSKKDRTQLTQLFDTLTDYNNYSRIIRLKKYYNMSNDAVRGHLLNYGSFTGRKLDRILKKDSFEDVERALHETSIGKKGMKLGPDNEMALQGRYEMCRHHLYFSSNSDIVLLAYYIVSETELSNVIAVVEGVRYSMAPESIYETLIV